MKQCCVLRPETNARCTNLIPNEDEACDECCDLLEALLETKYLEALYAGTLPGLQIRRRQDAL